jgi:hypothetical protein
LCRVEGLGASGAGTKRSWVETTTGSGSAGLLGAGAVFGAELACAGGGLVEAAEGFVCAWEEEGLGEVLGLDAAGDDVPALLGAAAGVEAGGWVAGCLSPAAGADFTAAGAGDGEAGEELGGKVFHSSRD